VWGVFVCLGVWACCLGFVGFFFGVFVFYVLFFVRLVGVFCLAFSRVVFWLLGLGVVFFLFLGFWFGGRWWVSVCGCFFLRFLCGLAGGVVGGFVLSGGFGWLVFVKGGVWGGFCFCFGFDFVCLVGAFR